MTPAEQETIDVFCRELALALRRITGKNIEIQPDMLPKPVDMQAEPADGDNPELESKQGENDGHNE